ncbi:protocatechuate 3,4-dioxygenase [Pseudomaricurvus alkylphenolicus]|jgi:protocatechuate 4,5-dioxygenase beta chain|uniref:class III extradiol dioxygenase family protein n=1 Tax=Pseudomaricurvus alkylphenolicus TaxID=1306991 RepID=UPI0014201F5B|nr:class III extradiol dioxygenase family protein [Pseudomaricurvus alkylphenolicus]NIB38761.1 protocatechuate 3,4-dioxygenase [Pseudomaricurvus alkylphenolicus]
MAKIIGGVTTSHIPAVGNAISDGVTQEHYWKRFFDGYQPVHAWLDEKKPDVIIVVYNDHGLNFFLDKAPTFAIGCADQYENADEGWGLKPTAPFTGDAQFSWHLAESLIEQEFDMCTCQEMLVDHGFVNPVRVLYGDHEHWPVKTIPLAVNTVQHPLPSAKRCFKLGQALKQAIESYPEDINVAVVGTGGMSHQLQGERAGIIDVDYDLACMDSVINDPAWFYNQSNAEIIEKAGTEGIETIMWLVMRGALGDKVNCLHKHYHAPISNTGAGVLLLEAADE